MSKRKTDWASTPQGRFLRWMRFGGEPMDELLVERINGEQPENTLQETSDVAAHLLLREQDQKDAENEAAIAHDIQKWTNTSGKKGKKYYYKVQVRVYDENGKLAAKTALKQCKYAARTWSKAK